MNEAGYLFFRRLLREEVLEVRRGMTKIAQKYHYVREGTDPMDGYFALGDFGNGYGTSPLYREMLDLDSFNQLPHTPVLMGMFQAMLQGDVQEDRRRVIRFTFPGQTIAANTPIEQGSMEHHWKTVEAVARDGIKPYD